MNRAPGLATALPLRSQPFSTNDTRHRIATLCAASLLALSAGCGGGGGSDSSAPEITSGTVASSDGMAEVVVPAGALAQPTPISVTPEPSPPAGGDLVGPAYEFGPSGTTFNAPVSITITYDPASLPSGLSENALALATYSGSSWQPLPDSQVDAAGNSVTGTTTHFSLFGVMVANSPPVAINGTLAAVIGGTATGSLGATDADNDPLTFRIGANASQGTATITNAATGSYTFNANINAGGSDSFTFIANDGISDSNVAVVQITYVVAPNLAPNAQDLAISAFAGQTVSGTFSASDSEGDPLTYRIVANGTLGTASIANPALPQFTYLAPAGTSGTDTFTYVANDGVSDSNIATVTVTVQRLMRLTLRKSNFGAGTVLQTLPDTDPRLVCDLTCSLIQFNYVEGTTVTLAAIPELGSTPATSWTGCDTATPAECTVTMDAFRVVDIAFEPAVTITRLPFDDNDGTFNLSWSCTGSVLCGLGQYQVQESNLISFNTITDQYALLGLPQAPTFGSHIFGNRTNANYCFRLAPGTSLSWSRPLCARVGPLERDSVTATGRTLTNGDSFSPSMSAYNRMVVFASSATNLVPNDTNNASDIFIRFTNSGTVQLLSLSSAEVQGNDRSHAPVITPDGRYIAFHSYASNLVAGDTNGGPDYFVRDRGTGTTERVSVTDLEQERTGGSNLSQLDISADGRFVVFMTDQDLADEGDFFVDDIYLRDRQLGTTIHVTPGLDGGQHRPRHNPKISANGRYVVYESVGSVLTPRNTNRRDLYRWDRINNTRMLISNNAAGVAANEDSFEPDISADGTVVVFSSVANNLVAGDTNGVRDVFAKNLVTGEVLRMPETIGTLGVIEGNARSFGPRISQDGTRVVYTSEADNLMTFDNNGAADVFMQFIGPPVARFHVSRANLSGHANDFSGGAFMGPEGMWAGFSSPADNLTFGETDDNLASDVFTRGTIGSIFDQGGPSDDLDNDGLDNFTELTVTFTLHADPDSDNDGASDGAENAAGTDPWNPASKP